VDFYFLDFWKAAKAELGQQISCETYMWPEPCMTLLHCTAQHYTALHGTAQHCTALHSTAQHSTARHSTALHCTALNSKTKLLQDKSPPSGKISCACMGREMS